MDFTTDLKIEHNKLIHNGRLKPYELADLVARSHNYLCRISSLTEDVPFPSDLEDRIMDLQRYYGPLELKARRHGFALVKLPRVKMSKGEENELANEYQHASADAVKNLIEFIKHPDPKSYKALINSMDSVIEKSIGLSKWAAKKASKQLEMF